jgi:hypothetical protein
MSVDYDLLLNQCNSLDAAIAMSMDAELIADMKGIRRLLKHIFETEDGANLSAITKLNSRENGATAQNDPPVDPKPKLPLFSLDYLRENGVLELEGEGSDDDDTAYIVNSSYVVFLEKHSPKNIIHSVTRFQDGSYSVIIEGTRNHSIDEGLDGDCALVFIQSDLAACVSKF